MLARARRVSRTAAVLSAAAVTLSWIVTGPALAATDPDDGDTPLVEEPAGADAEQDLVSFGIAPAGPERPDDRPFLQVGAAPGSVIYEHVALINQDDEPIELHVYAGDVINADSGLAVTPRSEESTGAGSWVDFGGLETVVVPAQTPEDGYGYAIVPFTVTIPTNAEPGDHSAGIVASLLTIGEGGDNAPNIELEQRVAARVYIDVDGEARAGLEVVDVQAEYIPGALVGPGSMEVSYTIRNTGNVRMAVEPAVEVAGPFGLLPESADGERVDELLPGSEVLQTVTVDGVWPLVREDVTVSAAALPGPGGLDPDLGSVTASVVVWAIPWVILGLLLLLVALMVLWARRRRRRPRGRRVATRRGPGSRAAANPGAGSGPAGERTPVGAASAPTGGR